MGKTVKYPIDLPSIIAGLEILGVSVVGGASGDHNRALSSDKTLSSNDYILAPEYYRISADTTLTISADAVLRVL